MITQKGHDGVNGKWNIYIYIYIYILYIYIYIYIYTIYIYIYIYTDRVRLLDRSTLFNHERGRIRRDNNEKHFCHRLPSSVEGTLWDFLGNCKTLWACLVIL